MKEEGGRAPRISGHQEGVCCKQARCRPARLGLIPLTAALDRQYQHALSSGNADLVFLCVRACVHAWQGDAGQAA